MFPMPPSESPDLQPPAPRVSDLARVGGGPSHDYLQGLNPEQRDAVESTEGPVLVLAGAGTGKTRVLTTRLAHILSTGRARPWELLAVTFTNKAAREMRERITAIIGPQAEGLRWLGTFHSIAAQILRRHAELLGLKSSYTIIDPDDQERLIKQLLEAENIDAKRWTPKHFAGLIDHWKNRGWTPDKLPPSEGAADTFWAPNLQYFMDSPTEISDFQMRSWKVQGNGKTYTFRLAVHSQDNAADVDTFAAMVEKLIQQHIKLFGNPPDYDFGTYTFIADYMPQIDGDGMEHRNSTMISEPMSLHDGKFQQIDTVAHEFTHAWNVERMRPQGLEPFDFTRANPTRSLWFAEGFTQYIGPLMVRRAGESSVDDWAQQMGAEVNYVVEGPGRHYGSPQEMSLRAPFVDAATAIDPVNGNIFTSYYPYGAVIALALIVAQPDLGQTVSLGIILLALLWYAGLPLRVFVTSLLAVFMAGAKILDCLKYEQAAKESAQSDI